MHVFERWALRKIRRCYAGYKRHKKHRYFFGSLRELYRTPWLFQATFAAFMIGFIATLPIIFLEVEWRIFDTKSLDIKHLFIYAAVTIALVAAEFYLLYRLGLCLVGKYLYFAYHLYPHSRKTTLREEAFVVMLARIILEMPAKNTGKFCVDHRLHSDADRLAWILIYKIKVVVTNALLKLATKRMLIKTSYRYYTPYIATVGTGIWDAAVFYKTVLECRYKISVRFVITYWLRHKQEILLEPRHIKAIQLCYFLYGEFNGNYDYMLSELYNTRPFSFCRDDYLRDEVVLQADARVVTLLAAFHDTFPSSKQRRFCRFVDKKQVKRLKKALREGRIAYLYRYIDAM